MRETSPAAAAACVWHRSLRKLDGSIQTLGSNWILGAASFKLKHIQNLRA